VVVPEAEVLAEEALAAVVPVAEEDNLSNI